MKEINDEDIYVWTISENPLKPVAKNATQRALHEIQNSQPHNSSSAL